MGIRSFGFRIIVTTFVLSLGCMAAKASYNDFSERSDLDYEKFVEMIGAYDLQSIEATLEAMKETYPLYFQNYIMMYKSRSLQEGSYLNPRVLLYDTSSKFIVSFNGEPSQRGYNRLEIMQFRDDEARFEFREVIFPRGGGEPTFSEANPRKCMVCHQSTERKNIDPRPNWEPYNTWPGAYGSLSGRMYENLSYYDKNEMEKRGAHPSVVEGARLEYSQAAKFFAEIQPEHPRYKFLSKDSFDPHHPTELTQFLANINSRRIIRIISEDLGDVYKYLKWPLATLVKCGRISIGNENLEKAVKSLKKDGFKVSAKTRRQKKSDWEIKQIAIANLQIMGESLTEENIKKEFHRIVAAKGKDFWNDPEISISEGLEVLFEPLGISTADWSMDFQTRGTLAFRERFGTPSNTPATLRRAYVARRGRTDIYKSGACNELSAKAEASYQRLVESDLYQELLVKKHSRRQFSSADLLRRCVKCHSDYDPSIPFIAFDQESSLRNLLNQPSQLNPSRTLMEDLEHRLGDMATNSERMPMGPIVDRRVRLQLLEYFKQLADSE